MKKFLLLAPFLLSVALLKGQTKNFIDQPYIEVTGNADSLVTPDEIYIRIHISEKDTKNKVSVNALEEQMTDALKGLGINIARDLVIQDMTSNFKTYLLKSKDILKSKQYLLKVNSAEMAGKVFIKLEDLGISNTSIDHVDLSNKEDIGKILLSQAVGKAHAKAVALTTPLGQKTGKAIQITAAEQPRALNNSLQGRLSGVVVAYGTKQMANEAPVPDISFEKIPLNATVNVKFVLE